MFSIIQNQSFYADSLSILFYKRFSSALNENTTYRSNSSNYNTVIQGMLNLADSFMGTVQQHCLFNGSLHEEFDRFLSNLVYVLMLEIPVSQLAQGI
jgi:hypothetical protein